MEFTLDFLKFLFYGLYLASPLLLSLALVIIIIGQIVGRMESWTRFDALYWAFITATTVGYGDIRPTCRMAKSLSVLIALIGLIFTGIVVAISLRAATYAFAEHIDLPEIRTTIEQKKGLHIK